MAEEEDPFQAAMSAMDDIEKDGQIDANIEGEPESEGAAPDTDGAGAAEPEADAADPFADALGAMEGGAGDDIPDDPFAAALGAMDGDGAAVEGDPFDAALQVATTAHNAATAQGGVGKAAAVDVNFLMDIKLDITFEVGRAKMYISDLLSLGQGSVIELHRLVGEELEIFVNGHLFATGEVVVVNEKFGAKISQIIPPELRIERLGTHAIL